MQVGDFLRELTETLVEKKGVTEINLIIHRAQINWRQRNPGLEVGEETKRKIREGVTQIQRPMIAIKAKDFITSGDEIIKQIQAYYPPNEYLISFISAVRVGRDNTKHIPTMNYHPDGYSPASFDKSVRPIEEFLAVISNFNSALFETDRYFHAYGLGVLLDPPHFHKWVSLHLNAAYLISPRYGGQSIRDGFTPTRITALTEGSIKRVVPTLYKIVRADSHPASWDHINNPDEYLSSLPEGIEKIQGVKGVYIIGSFPEE